MRRQARHRPRRPGHRAELQPLHRRADPDALLGPDAQRPRPDPRQAQRQLRRGAGPALRPGRPLRLDAAGSSTPRTPTSTACTRPSSRRRTPTTARCRPVRARTCTASSATTPASRVHLNPDYNPRFRTIATNFQGWPGLYTVTDRRPPRSAATVLAPGHHGGRTRRACDLGADRPAAARRGPARTSARHGTATGPSPSRARASAPPGHRLGHAATPRPTVPVPTVASWSDTSIVVHGPGLDGTAPAAAPSRCRSPTAPGGRRYNGLTIRYLDAAPRRHRRRRPTNPNVAEVGPGQAVRARSRRRSRRPGRPRPAGTGWSSSGRTPRPRTTRAVSTPRTSSCTTASRIQGVGPGGFDRRTAHVGARLDHRRLGLQPGQRRRHGLDQPARLADATPASPTCRTPRW